MVVRSTSLAREVSARNGDRRDAARVAPKRCAEVGDDYDESLLPKMPETGRYDTYRNAVKLADAVGIRNLYAAYFCGDLKLIGGKLR